MRTVLEEGTVIRVPGGALYKIIGEPVGEGGGSILYPARKYLSDEKGAYRESPLLYVIKECFPLSSKYFFYRNEAGEIRPDGEEKEADQYLMCAKQMQRAEDEITGKIYHTGFRLTPVLESFQEVEISLDQGSTFQKVCNSIAVLESLSEKGRSLKQYIKERKHFPAAQAFRIIEQVLYAVREVHQAGYLHLDLQDGNIFLKGVLEDGSGMVSLLDFGSARKRMEDGFCEKAANGILYSTPGFTAPEMRLENEGTLRLGAAADIYSIGYLTLLLLTGHRFTAKEVFSNETGRYIPRFSLRKTRCPKHLVGRMQSILAKSLANRPEDRYASADEMLREVTAFLAMLAPYQDPLSAVEYDAFICYKHGPLVTAASKELRNALERYPHGGVWGKKPIGKVFLDEGELASCADFGERIREALKNSGWLVVVCSKETKESPWVNKEIRTFLEYHDVSHVLAVITDGEPKDVFPEALLKQGMDESSLFAADARGKSVKQILKNIRGDVKLKIAAPILHTTFDTLKQRRKVYEIKRTSAFVCIFLLVMSAFWGYAAVKSRQIARQAVQLADEHKAALRGQALYLSEQAKQSYRSHDMAGAIKQALQAYDLLAADGLFLPELIQTLTEAMGVYTLPSDAAENMTATGVIPSEERGGFKEYFLDREGKRLFTADDTHMYIWDTDACQCIHTAAAPWSIKKFSRNYLIDQKNQYLFVLRDGIHCYDYSRKSYVWSYTFEEALADTVVSADGTRIAAVAGQHLYLLATADGRLLKTSVLPEMDTFSINGASLALSSDNSKIAFVKEGKEGTASAGMCETVLYDVPEDHYAIISSFQNNDPSGLAQMKLRFTQDDRLFAVYSSGINTVYDGRVRKYYSEKKALKAGMYDLGGNRMLWEMERDYMALDEEILLPDIEESGSQVILLAYGNRCEILDLETGKRLGLYETDAPIVRAWDEKEGFVLVLENGDLLYHNDGEKRLEGYTYFPEDIVGCDRHGPAYYVKCGNAIIKYQQGIFDEGYKSCGELPDHLREPTQDTEAISGDGQYSAYIAESTVVVEGKRGHSKEVLEMDDPPLSLYWLPDPGKLLIGFADKASLYDTGTKSLSETGEFAYRTFSLAAWQTIDQSTVIYMGDTYSYVLEVGEGSLGVLYCLKNFVSYDPLEDVFYFSSEEYDMDRLDEGMFSEGKKIGKIERYSTEEIVGMARKRVG